MKKHLEHLVDSTVTYVLSFVKSLNDDDYMNVLEAIAERLTEYVKIKSEELDKG